MIVDEFRLSSGQAKQYEQEGLNAQAAPVPFAGLGWAVETGMVRFRFAFTHHGHSLSHYGSLMFSFPRMLSSTRDVGQSMDRHIQTYIFLIFCNGARTSCPQLTLVQIVLYLAATAVVLLVVFAVPMPMQMDTSTVTPEASWYIPVLTHVLGMMAGLHGYLH